MQDVRAYETNSQNFGCCGALMFQLDIVKLPNVGDNKIKFLFNSEHSRQIELTRIWLEHDRLMKVSQNKTIVYLHMNKKL